MINKALNSNLSNDDCDDCWAALKLPAGLFDSPKWRMRTAEDWMQNVNICVQPFPDITICNVYPLNAVDESTWTRYSQDIETKRQKWSCDSINKALKLNLSNDDCDGYWAELKLPTGLFDSLPLFDDGSDAEKQLIVGCTLTDWDWGSSDAECIVKTRWDPDYYKCYTIQVDQEYRQVRHISSRTDRYTFCVFEHDVVSIIG
jgi:hypothetical protein